MTNAVKLNHYGEMHGFVVTDEQRRHADTLSKKAFAAYAASLRNR